MIISLRLDTGIKRAASLVVLLLLSAMIVYLGISHFIINTLADDELVVLRSTLVSAAAFFPKSARLQARLAKVELAEAVEEADISRAESAALNAVRLAPWNSNNQLFLASVRNLQGDLNAAEAAMRKAVGLAPHSAQAHWQLANLLVRQDRLDEAIKEFHLAIVSDSGSSFLPGTLDVLWNLSGGNVEKLTQVVGGDSQKQLVLAKYLLKQSRLPEAATIYKSIERAVLLASPAATEFLNSLVSSGQFELAKELWAHLVEAEKSVDSSLLYNGGFEKELVPALSQFDWKIAHSQYAILSFDSVTAHSGKRSLRMTLTGRDTTVLGKEVTQTIVVRPAMRYRLECYAKTDRLITTEALQITVIDPITMASLASSNPISAESSDWHLYGVDFVTSIKSKAVLISIKRLPRFSYDEPSTGTIWLDDFTLRETGQSK